MDRGMENSTSTVRMVMVFSVPSPPLPQTSDLLNLQLLMSTVSDYSCVYLHVLQISVGDGVYDFGLYSNISFTCVENLCMYSS